MAQSATSFLVPTRFVWRFGGNLIHLCGSFTRWVETVPMNPVEGQPGVFTVLVHLPPGYHQYKFIVDGEAWGARRESSMSRDAAATRVNHRCLLSTGRPVFPGPPTPPPPPRSARQESGATMRPSRSCPIPWAMSTTGCSCDGATRPRSGVLRQR